MGRPKGSNSNARERLVAAAGRSFRAGGFGGVGVDGLAKDAGLTSGAFYAHFDSKMDAFRLAIVDGLELLIGGIERFQDEHGEGWLAPFVDFYFGPRMEAPLEDACALPTLTTDAARADVTTREAYQQELEKLIAVIAKGLGGDDARERAMRLLAVFAGGAAIARAVSDDALRAELIATVRDAAKKC